jgi:hypothetical protein
VTGPVRCLARSHSCAPWQSENCLLLQKSLVLAMPEAGHPMSPATARSHSLMPSVRRSRMRPCWAARDRVRYPRRSSSWHEDTVLRGTWGGRHGVSISGHLYTLL